MIHGLALATLTKEGRAVAFENELADNHLRQDLNARASQLKAAKLRGASRAELRQIVEKTSPVYGDRKNLGWGA